MGWFDEQIRLRKTKDNEIMERAMVDLADSILGTNHGDDLKDEKDRMRGAVSTIVGYLGGQIPSDISFPDNVGEQIALMCRPSGIMYRDVELDDKWYKECFGPLLVFGKEDGSPYALLPNAFGVYAYYDEKKGKVCKINAKNSKLFINTAITFYKPFPSEKMSVKDLIKYSFSVLSIRDIVSPIVLIAIVSLLGLLVPKIYYFLTEYVLPMGSFNLLYSTLFFYLSLVVTLTLISAIRSIADIRITTKVGIYVEAAVMARILSLPTSFFKKYSSGDLANRMTRSRELCEYVINVIVNTSLTSIFSLLYITQMVNYGEKLVIPALIIIACIVTVLIVVTKMRRKISSMTMGLSVKNSGVAYAMISGILKIKLSGSEKRAFARWANGYSKQAKLEYNPPFLLKMNGVLITAISLIGTIWMYYLAIKAGMNAASYYAFEMAYGVVMAAFTSLSNSIFQIADLDSTTKILEPILTTAPENEKAGKVLTSVSGNIDINNLSFSYGENCPDIFENLSVKIKAGQYIAIVGKSGCGKSTLIRLLLGFEKPNRGAIYYDGKDLASLDKKSLRKCIGVVLQDGKLVNDDIFTNIVLSSPHLTLNDAWEAAQIAGIDEDIAAMPMGMGTMIAEGCGGISGGQKQRIMIARAIVAKPKILIFDEATSALDNRTQKRISEALDNMNCTRIVVAHRLSTIKNCDRIVMIDEGRIIEDGTYEELISRGGAFAQLVEKQRIDL